MPFEIQPLGAAPSSSGRRSSYSPSWDWVARQPFHRDVAEWQTGGGQPGSILGGPDSSSLKLLSDPNKYKIFAPAPAITERAQRQQVFGRFGSVTLDMIDPFMSMQSVAEGLGSTPQAASDVARGPQTFLGERDIDPFGQGAEGVPARLFDYATGWLGALYDHATGKPITAPVPQGAGALKYNFQRDPAYWALVTAEGASDDFLAGVARQLAGQYVSNNDNAYLAEKLLTQFKLDRDQALGLSSGDRRLDYQAKLAFSVEYVNDRTQKPAIADGPFRKGASTQPYEYLFGRAPVSQEANVVAAMALPSAIVGALPFVGADIRDAIYRHPEQIEEAWDKLTAEQRAVYFGRAGTQMLLGDAAVWLPLLGGLGAVEAVAARAGGVALQGWKAYEYTRNVTTAVMATGLVVATTNWALEVAVPGYAEDFGKRLDYARPISGSQLAGLINQMGFFASGTFGGYTAARTITRVAGKAVDLTPIKGGARELSYFKNVFGGSAMRRELAGTGLPDVGVLDLSPKRSFLSHILNWREADRRAIQEAYVRGFPVGIKGLDDLLPGADREAAANAALLRGIDQSGVEAEGIVKAMMEARRPRPIFSGEAQRVHDAAVKLARFVDDEMARLHVEEYGPAWLTRRAGAYTVPALEKYARDAIARLGGDPAKLAAHNEEGWGQIIRYLHNYEFDRMNGLLAAAGEGSDELPKLLLMQADHLFANDVDTILQRLRGDDADLAAATAASTIRSKREAAAWFAKEWDPPAGVTKAPENVQPAELADWLDEVRPALPSRRATAAGTGPTADMPLNVFHAELEKGGLWTLGFKPVDDAGNAISYVRRSNGAIFKSPWIEYPMGTGEAIDLGNRTLLASKIDGVTRGFRTWRIVEFQKGLLYRRLSGRLDVSAEQIERFHLGLMRLARDTGAQPQTLGAVARATGPIWGKELIQEKIDKLVGEVFGPGKMRTRSGELVDVNWADEIAKSYRQAFRLNLTAGLTSFLKANLGEVGSQIAWTSDIAYVMWRFNLSPIFKGGELLESAQFNAMRGVRGVGPMETALYYRAGIGNDFGAFSQELPFDPLIQGSAGVRPTYVHEDPSARFAASAAFYARHIPEDFEMRARAAFEQTQAAGMREVHMGGQLPSEGWLARNPNARVVDPDTIPEDFTTELAEIRPDRLDPDVLASEQTIWHATTALNKVYAEGIKARQEIKAVSYAPDMGEGFRAWRERTRLMDEPGGTRPLYVHMDSATYAATEQAHRIKPGGALSANWPVTADPDRLLSRTEGYIVELDPTYIGVKDAPHAGLEATPFDPGARNRIWRWDEQAEDYLLIWHSPYAAVPGGAGQALGGGTGRKVSVTYRHDHALEIARRLQFASRAARNEVTNAEILEHFANWYGDDFYTMAKVLGANPLVGADGTLHLSAKGSAKIAGGIDDFDSLERWMSTVGNIKGAAAKYNAVKSLDEGLTRTGGGDFTGAVILAGSVDDIAKINPDEVGVVQLAARKGTIPKDGADDFELEFASDDLLVIDDRQPLGPLAEDEDGLLRQLRATLAPEPKAGQMTIGDYMVGGNGFAPGLEERARRIIVALEDLQAEKLDGGPTFTWESITASEREAFATRLVDQEGWRPYNGPDRWDSAPDPFMAAPSQLAWAKDEAYAAAGLETLIAARSRPKYLSQPYERTRLDGSTEVREIRDLYDEFQRRPGMADSLDDIAGTPEALFDRILGEANAAEQAKAATGWKKDAWDTFWHPAKWKLEQATKLQIKLARDEFPSMLALSGNHQLIEVFRGLNLPQNRWLDWLIEDRTLLAKWLDSGAQTDFDTLLAHAGDDARAAFDELYASEEWASLSALLGANFRSAGQEAFGVHFFSPYRSPLERSINHPLLGIYPASWSIKAAREWIRFLYNNRTLGIDLGMAPAQAIAQVVHAQHAAFAEMTDQEMDEWLENGPLGSPLFIFNLIMPGDWSALPFAASRTIRDYARPILQGNDLPDAGEVFANNLRTIGLTRDARLFFESIGQIGDLLRGPETDDPEPATPTSTLKKWSVRGGEVLTYDPAIR